MDILEDPDFQAVLADLSKERKDGKLPRPNRFQVRALLVPLGAELLEDEAAAGPALERVRALIARNPESWARAVDDELSLAVTEHVRSCDPAYLRHPKYDFPYTVDARARLEARLRAAEALDLGADGALLDQIERADELLAPFLDAHRDGPRDTPH
ncbi:MAG: hypothetical protein JNL28_12190 [Planctomycetes bacterium]|nr:hypothetical protein [Planctomycetota bacterium]